MELEKLEVEYLKRVNFELFSFEQNPRRPNPCFPKMTQQNLIKKRGGRDPRPFAASVGSGKLLQEVIQLGEDIAGVGRKGDIGRADGTAQAGSRRRISLEE